MDRRIEGLRSPRTSEEEKVFQKAKDLQKVFRWGMFPWEKPMSKRRRKRLLKGGACICGSKKSFKKCCARRCK